MSFKWLRGKSSAVLVSLPLACKAAVAGVSFRLVWGPIHSVELTTFLSDQDEMELKCDEDAVPASG